MCSSDLLKGTFASPLAGVNAYRFSNLRGSVLWVPEKLEIANASAGLYGGTAKFGYLMAPLGQPASPAMSRFDAAWTDVDLTQFTDFLEVRGIRLAGRATGRNLLIWPNGHYSEHRGDGELQVRPPADTLLMTRRMPVDAIEAEAARGAVWGPFDNTDRKSTRLNSSH